MPVKHRTTEELKQREAKIFEQRDNAKNKIDEALGIQLTPLQFLQIRQLVAEYDKCEEAIGRIQERMEDLAGVV